MQHKQTLFCSKEAQLLLWRRTFPVSGFSLSKNLSTLYRQDCIFQATAAICSWLNYYNLKKKRLFLTTETKTFQKVQLLLRRWIIHISRLPWTFSTFTADLRANCKCLQTSLPRSHNGSFATSSSLLKRSGNARFSPATVNCHVAADQSLGLSEAWGNLQRGAI